MALFVVDLRDKVAQRVNRRLEVCDPKRFRYIEAESLVDAIRGLPCAYCGEPSANKFCAACESDIGWQRELLK